MSAPIRPPLHSLRARWLPDAALRALGAGARGVVTAGLLALAARPAAAGPPAAAHPLDDIRAAALAAIGGPGAQGEARLDSRLRMAACGQPLAATARSTRIAQVRCPDSPGWTLQVPVVLQGAPLAALQPAAAAPAPVAAQPVKRGDPVVLVSRGGPVEVRMPGLAMGNADRVGDRVGVQNTSSGRTVRGRLTGEPGVVEVVF